MALTPDTKAAVRNRLQFYREMGIGPLYRRATPDAGEALVEELAEVADELSAAQDQVTQESHLPTATDRESRLRVILNDIGPNCTRCKLSRLGRKQIVFGTGDPHAE